MWAGNTGLGRGQAVEDKIVDFFVANMISLRVVESASFLNLVRALNPTKKIMSRRTLGRKIHAKHQAKLDHITSLPEGVPWVATTVRNREFQRLHKDFLDNVNI